MLDLALGLNILTSKIAFSNLPPQNPQAASRLSFMMSNTVHSYDKHTKIAMVACTVTSGGSNSFDKDSCTTIGLPWQPYTLAHQGYTRIVPCGGVFDPSRIKVSVSAYIIVIKCKVDGLWRVILGICNV